MEITSVGWVDGSVISSSLLLFSLLPGTNVKVPPRRRLAPLHSLSFCGDLSEGRISAQVEGGRGVGLELERAVRDLGNRPGCCGDGT